MDDNTSLSQEMEEIEMANLEFLTRVDTCCDSLYSLYFYQGKEFSRSYVDNSIQPLSADSPQTNSLSGCSTTPTLASGSISALISSIPGIPFLMRSNLSIKTLVYCDAKYKILEKQNVIHQASGSQHQQWHS